VSEPATMSNARAVRYRRLALASGDKANADLLLKLADECDRGYSAPLNGLLLAGYPAKMQSRQKQNRPDSISDIEDVGAGPREYFGCLADLDPADYRLGGRHDGRQCVASFFGGLDRHSDRGYDLFGIWVRARDRSPAPSL